MADLWATDLPLRARYAQGGGIYRLLPAAVARPTDVPTLRAVLAAARAAGLSITPRGSGSAMDGGNVGDGLVLDLTAFHADACVVDAARRTAYCSPSLTLPQLHTVTAPHGLHLPLDPSSARWATLGGLVSTNAAGARTVRDGAMRRWVEALTLECEEGPLHLQRGVPPDATHPVVQRWHADVEPLLARHRTAIEARWPRTAKNSFGYDLGAWWEHGELIDMVIGAEGTLGVVSEITLRLAPRPMHRLGLRVALSTRGALVPAIETIRAADPAMLELLDASFLRLVEAALPGDPAAVLLVELEGDDATAVMARAETTQSALAALGAGVITVEIATEEKAREALWEIRHGASPRLAGLTDGRQSLQVIEDGCVPVARLGDYLDAVDAACAVAGVDAVMFGHAGDGHVHVNLLPNLRDPDWLTKVRAIYAEVADALLRLGGTPAGEHGAGRLRAGLIERFLGAEAVECFRAIKAAFDPAGRYNPGVILSDDRDPFTRLKVGADAMPLPDGVAEALQRIEREARWGESRWSDRDPRTEDRW
jgi:FAD/FMN-containing dehydrogenase